MPDDRIKIAEDGYRVKPTNACKVCHTGVIGHEDAAGLEKSLHQPNPV